MKLKKINLPSLVKSYNFIYYACIFMYVIIVTMLLGFGLYFHSNSTIPILDASTQEDLTVVTIVTKEFSPVLVQEELTPLTKDTFTLPDRGWLD
jgi:ATP/ADP translocase